MPERFTGKYMPPGPKGEHGAPGPDGKPGEPGKSLPDLLAGTVRQTSVDHVGSTASPRQLAMVLHSAELDYLNGLLETALDRLFWVCQTTIISPEDIVPLEPVFPLDHPFFKRQSRGGLPTLRARAQFLIKQMEIGLDYYGYPAKYVELLDKAFYENYVSSLLDIGRKVEKRQEEFWKSRADVASRKAILLESRKDMESVSQKQNEELQRIGIKVDEVQNQIQDLNSRVSSLVAAVEAAEPAFKSAVERQSGACSLSEILMIVGTLLSTVSTVVGAATMIASRVSAFQTANDKTKDFTDADWQKLNGTVRAKYETDKNFISVLKVVGENVKGIGAAYTEIRKLLGDDQDQRAKLVITQQDYEKVLEPYMNLPEAQNLKAVLDALVRTSRVRNDKVLEYTAIRVAQDSTRASFAQGQANLEYITQAMSRTNNVELDECGTYLDVTLEEIKLQIARGLYLAKKSLEFWSLENVPFEIRYKTVDELEKTRTQLKDRERVFLEERGRAEQKFYKRKVRFDVTNAQPLIDQLRRNGQTTFSTPTETDQLPSSVWRNIRATAIRVRVPGVKTANSSVSLILRNHGVSRFRTTSGEYVEFVYNPRLHAVKYDYATDQDATSTELGGEKGLYADVSPFGVWSVELVPDDNPSLDTSAIEALELEFWGTFLARH